ncbi:MAG: ferredoxin [Chlamydiae bacterium SM23_39]|nr:MAG: ferredoxin [Chlamydiae bacterium SM23_39]
MKKVKLKIDGKEIIVNSNMTIMEAAQTVGIHIPRLCYHPHLSIEGACRVCIVQVKGYEYFITSCSFKVEDNMEVETNSPEVRQARRDIVELILDNHPRECQICERDTMCELQKLAYSLGIRERYFEGERKRYKLEDSSKAVIRNPEKCILCGRCVRVCSEIQGVYNLSQHYRGFSTIVTPAFSANMDDSVCIQCGQCINVCPTAAFLEKKHTDRVWEALNDKNKYVVVQTAPSIRAAIGEDFEYPPGTDCTGKMITAFKKLGFDAVFDTNIGADFTIVEESNELINRLKDKKKLPLITSCSPGWINFMEKFYPELIENTSSCKSPMSMVSTLTKTYYSKKINRDPKDIFVVAIMPCVAKKFEMDRKELMLDNIKLTDAVLTTREATWMIKSYGIDFKRLEDGEFDSPLGESTGAGDIFGTTGGVMEATLRTAAEVITGKILKDEDIEFREVRAVEGRREREVIIEDIKLSVAIANGLVNAKYILDKVVKKEKEFHVIEIMACPGGCIGGGGQPYPNDPYIFLDTNLLAKRAKVLYSIDKKKKYRTSKDNPSIKKIYEEFLEKPGSNIAKKLLHTRYSPKYPRGIR